MKDSEKRAIIEDEIRNTVRAEMKRVDIRRLVDEIMGQIVEQHMRDYTFPEKSIPSSSIDFSDFSLDQDRCNITHIDNFSSGGITDTSTTDQITVTDDGVRIKSLTVDNLNIIQKINVKGKVRIGDPTYVKIVESVNNQAMSKFADKIEKIDWAVENIVKLQNDQGKIKAK